MSTHTVSSFPLGFRSSLTSALLGVLIAGAALMTVARAQAQAAVRDFSFESAPGGMIVHQWHPNGKHLVSGVVRRMKDATVPQASRVLRLTDEGALDPLFTPIEDAGSAVTTADGKIIAFHQDAVRRYLENGEIDPSFHSLVGAGVLRLLADGRLLAMHSGSVRRYLSDGSSDTSFTPIAGELLDVDAAGRIYVTADLYIRRHTPDGAIDAAFQPYLYASLNHRSVFAGLNNGKVLISENQTGETNWTLRRLGETGTVDATFTPLVSKYAIQVLPLPDGTRLLFETVDIVPNGSFVILRRLRLDGGLDAELYTQPFYSSFATEAVQQEIGAYFLQRLREAAGTGLNAQTFDVSNSRTRMHVSCRTDGQVVFSLVDSWGFGGNSRLHRYAYGLQAPAILRHPASAAVGMGASAYFSVAALGAAVPAFQWQRRAAGAGSWENLHNDGSYTGVTTSMLTVRGTAANRGDQFRAVVTNAAGVSQSNAATLTVRSAQVDFDASGTADLVWRNEGSGAYATWMMNGTAIADSAQYELGAGWQVALTADFSGDGKADLLWRNETSGAVVLWQMNGTVVAQSRWLYDSGPAWVPSRAGDFNGDGTSDILWRNANDGSYAIWQLNACAFGTSVVLSAGAGWTVVAVADFNGDGKSDLLWRNASSGAVVLWEMNGVAVTASTWVYNGGAAWAPVQFADFNGDGKTDILWRHATSGEHATWLMNGASLLSSVAYGALSGWSVIATQDFDGDGVADILWRNASSGGVVLWKIGSAQVVASAWLYSGGPEWVPQLFADFNGDGRTDILWRNSNDGVYAFWLLDGGTVIGSHSFTGPAGWLVFPTMP